MRFYWYCHPHPSVMMVTRRVRDKDNVDDIVAGKNSILSISVAVSAAAFVDDIVPGASVVMGEMPTLLLLLQYQKPIHTSSSKSTA